VYVDQVSLEKKKRLPDRFRENAEKISVAMIEAGVPIQTPNLWAQACPYLYLRLYSPEELGTSFSSSGQPSEWWRSRERELVVIRRRFYLRNIFGSVMR
jgi:hypothetical protein